MKVQGTKRRQKELPGRKQAINLYFNYAGQRCCIPAIYHFPEGIKFDIVTMLKEKELKTFLEKYKDAEENLTPFQQRFIENEHPYKQISLNAIKINGRHSIKEWSSTSGLHISWLNDFKMEEVKKSYKKHLHGVNSFACATYTLPLYKKLGGSRCKIRNWLFPKKIRKIEIEIGDKSLFLPIGISFELPQNFSDVHAETFVHPKTHKQHELYFQNVERGSFEMPTDKKLYFYCVAYEIYPKLDKGETLQFDNSMQMMEESKEDRSKKGMFVPHAANAIGIIGCSGFSEDNKVQGVHGLPLHYCITQLSYKENDPIKVSLDGIDVKCIPGKKVLWKYKKCECKKSVE